MNPYRRRAVFGLGLLAGVVLVVAYQVRFRARWAVERYERQLVAAGETLAVGPLVPPTVLPRSNGAPLFNRAMMGGLIWRKTLLETNLPPSMRMVAPGRAMVGWAQPDVCFDSTNTNTWDELREKFIFERDGQIIAQYRGKEDEDTSLTQQVRKAESECLKDAKVKLYVSQDHVADFLACVRSRKKPITSEQVGGRTAICCHLMNLAYLHRQKIKWDPAKLTFAKGSGDPKWLTRDYRASWKI